MTKQKVILAFSGGLDTTFCILHLIEKGHEVVTVTINTGGFSDGELASIEEKATKLGAIKHYTVNANIQIYDQIIQYLIKFNALYEGDYPIMVSDRYIICQEMIRIAKLENTKIIAHGSTSNGNDQVRFDAAIHALDNSIEILTPIKYLDISRDEEIAWLKERGIEVEKKVSRYSINQNVFGSTYSGSEIDANLEPSREAYILTQKDPQLTPDSTDYVSITFTNGVPTALNDQEMHGLDILMELNQRVGRYGFGSRIYTGDCIIGIKGHLMFEAPGLLALIEAHRKLEQYVLTKQQLKFNNQASEQWTDLVYSGLYYEPLVRNLETYADHVQQAVTGKVKLRIILNQVQAVEIESPFSLINDKVATYAQKGSWSNVEADGFIKLYSMQQTIANNRH